MINSIVQFIANIFRPKPKENCFHISFNKETDSLWYFDYPNWRGAHHNLQMVNGADSFLNYYNRIYPNSDIQEGCVARVEMDIERSNEPILEYEDNGRYIKLSKIGSNKYGATYKVDGLEGFNKTVWFCPVMLFYLGEYPKFAYIKIPMSR